MPHEWLSSARWRAWRKKCAGPERPRLLASLTESFADRAPIDWNTLLTRVAPPADRAFVENLRLLDRLRSPARPGALSESREPSPLLWLVAVLALAHTTTSLAIVAVVGPHADAPARHAVQVILAAAFAAAGLLLGGTAARDPRRVLLLATLACAASAFARAALGGAAANPLTPMLRSLWLEVFTPACLWQFAADFPRVTRFTRFDRGARWIAAAAWIFGSAIFLLNAGIAVGLMDEAPVAAWLPNRKSNVFWRVFTLSVLCAVAAIILRSRRAPFMERRRVHRLAWALTAGTAPFLAVGLLRSIVPSIDRWLLTASTPDRIWLDVLVVGPLAAMPLLAAAAVIADRPFEPQVPIERFLARRLAGAPRLRFTAGRVTALAHALARLRSTRSPREICSVIVECACGHLEAADARVLIADATGQYKDAFGVTCLAADTALTAMLRGVTRPLPLDPHGSLIRLLPQTDRNWLTSNGFELLAPIRLRDDSVAAIVACGAKVSRPRFARQDMAWLTAITAAASAAWETVSAAPGADEAAFECPRCGIVADSIDLPCACGTRAALACLPRCLDSQFVVQSRIGRGGMGVVYRARDTIHHRDVALKTVPRLEPGSVARLHAEARAMEALRHASLATIHEVAMWRGTPVLVLEYFPDGTLARRLRAGPLPAADVLWLARQVADALVYIHDRGALHGDLKPANIGLGPDAAPRLLDFGLATLIDAGTAGRAPGTVPYLPPEAFRGEPPGPLFDLWALAVVVAEALIGTHPFTARSQRATVRRILHANPAGITSHLPSPSRSLMTWLETALAPDPTRRFPNAREFRAALDRVIDASP